MSFRAECQSTSPPPRGGLNSVSPLFYNLTHSFTLLLLSIWKPGGRPCGFRYYRALGFLAHGPAPSPPAPSQMCLFVEACSAWLPAWFPAICAMAALSALSTNWNLSPVHSTHPQGALLQAVLGAANYLGLRII